MPPIVSRVVLRLSLEEILDVGHTWALTLHATWWPRVGSSLYRIWSPTRTLPPNEYERLVFTLPHAENLFFSKFVPRNRSMSRFTSALKEMLPAKEKLRPKPRPRS